jgi:hypothetical protein
MHQTGDYISNSCGFSAAKWLPATELYLDKINNDLTSQDWTDIFKAMRDLEESDTRDSQIQAGAPLFPKQREALLPADPPTPPPLD